MSRPIPITLLEYILNMNHNLNMPEQLGSKALFRIYSELGIGKTFSNRSFSKGHFQKVFL